MSRKESPIILMILILSIVIVALGQNIRSIYEDNANFQCQAESEKKWTTSNTSSQPHPQYNVLSYHIFLDFHPQSEMINGYTKIEILPVSIIEDRLTIDFAGLTIDSVRLNQTWVNISQQNELVHLQLVQAIQPADTQRIDVFYHGSPQKGLYFRENLYGDPVFYTHNEPFDAHFWFPCKDDPSDKAILTLSALVPNNFEVLSNGLKIEEKDTLDKKLFTWQENYPIATYLVSIAAAPYTIVTEMNDLNIPLQYYVYPEDLIRGEQALLATGEMLYYYSDWIGEYPFIDEKYAMSEAPLQEASAMENQTATTMRDLVMDNEQIIAHELAHQWWGNALTPLSFADIWLNEGFATYFDALFSEYKYGRAAFEKRMNDFRSAITVDGSLIYPVYDPPQEHLFGNAVYLKGAWILHMLRYQVGDSLFKQMSRTYFNRYKYQNVTTSDFIRVAEEISQRDLSVFFDQWLNYGGIPVITATWQQTDNLIMINLLQNQEAVLYQFEYEILLKGISRDSLLTFQLDQGSEQIVVEFSDVVNQIVLDPDSKILHSNNSPVYRIADQAGIIKIYPNPFRDQIAISYQTDLTQRIEIVIYDILGRKVATVLDEKINAGLHLIKWQSDDIAAGVYYCRLTASDKISVRKLIHIK